NVTPRATSNTNTVVENGTTSGNVITDDDGSGVDSDPDATDGFTVTHINGIQIVDGQTYTLTGGSQVTIHSAGSYTFATNGAFEYLGAGEQATLVCSYTITDDHGAPSPGSAAFTRAGVADPPAAHPARPAVHQRRGGRRRLLAGPGGDGDPGDRPGCGGETH